MKIRMRCSSCKQQYEIFMRNEIVSMALTCLRCDCVMSYTAPEDEGIKESDIRDMKKSMDDGDFWERYMK